MAQLFYGSIYLSDIPKDKITTSKKNGKKYLNITVWMNDQPDPYGNTASISIGQSEQERTSKASKVYIGNLKTSAVQKAASENTTTPLVKAASFVDVPDDLLPF